MLSGRWTCRRCYAANNPSDEVCGSCAWPRVPGSGPLPDPTAMDQGQMQPQPQPWVQQPAPAPRPWWTGLLRFAWILIPIGIIGFGILSQARRDDSGEIVGGGSVDVTELAVGDCFNASDDEEIADVDARPCTEPHEYEVIAIVTYPFDRGSDYPGDDAIADHAGTECEREFEEYVGVPYEDSVYYVSFLMPTEEGWNAGDRETICSGYDPGDSERTESMRGSER